MKNSFIVNGPWSKGFSRVDYRFSDRSDNLRHNNFLCFFFGFWYIGSSAFSLPARLTKSHIDSFLFSCDFLIKVLLIHGWGMLDWFLPPCFFEQVDSFLETGVMVEVVFLIIRVSMLGIIH